MMRLNNSSEIFYYIRPVFSSLVVLEDSWGCLTNRRVIVMLYSSSRRTSSSPYLLLLLTHRRRYSTSTAQEVLPPASIKTPMASAPPPPDSGGDGPYYQAPLQPQVQAEAAHLTGAQQPPPYYANPSDPSYDPKRLPTAEPLPIQAMPYQPPSYQNQEPQPHPQHHVIVQIPGGGPITGTAPEASHDPVQFRCPSCGYVGVTKVE